jgi:hypothetical protein
VGNERSTGTIDWEEIYLKLYAYTDHLLKSYHWFRKERAVFVAGKQVDDYIYEAIERYLRHPQNYNSSSGRSLISYLKRHIIRTLVGNDARGSENRLNVDLHLYTRPGGEDEGDDDQATDGLLPFAEALFDDQIDFGTIISEIRELVKNDVGASIIFEGRCEGMKRREIMEAENLEDTVYDNAMKRLGTVLKNTAIKYDLKRKR